MGQVHSLLEGHLLVLEGEVGKSCSIDSAHNISPKMMRICRKFSAVSSCEKASVNREANRVTFSVMDDEQAAASAIAISFNASTNSLKPVSEVGLPKFSASDSYVASMTDVFEVFTVTSTEAMTSGTKPSRILCIVSSMCPISVVLTMLATTLQNSVQY